MSLLQDLANGKEIQLSNGSKLTIQYETDANVFSLTIGGNKVTISNQDLGKLIEIEQGLRLLKKIEGEL